MGNIGLLKRALPFFATFALGLFVASFFANIGGPRASYRSKCRHEMRELRIENENLREENLRLLEQHDPVREFPVAPPVYLENEELESPSVDEPVLPRPAPVKSHKAHTR